MALKERMYQAQRAISSAEKKTGKSKHLLRALSFSDFNRA
jgi:hypothetical protein